MRAQPLAVSANPVAFGVLEHRPAPEGHVNRFLRKRNTATHELLTGRVHVIAGEEDRGVWLAR
jgi:hypothetical protein